MLGKLLGTRAMSKESASGGATNQNKHLKYDKLRLREWFNAMDTDHSGHVKRQTFLRFLIDNPTLRDIICSIYASQHGDNDCLASRAGSKDSVSSAYLELVEKPGMNQEKNVEQARKYRRLIAAWKEIDADKSGTLEWEEFVDYFRVNGFLLEYQVENNPKDRMTHLLASMHDDPEKLDAEEMEEFSALRGQHVDTKRSSTLGVIEASQILSMTTPAEAQDPDDPQFARRRRSLSKVAAGSAPRRGTGTLALPAQDQFTRIATTPLF